MSLTPAAAERLRNDLYEVGGPNEGVRVSAYTVGRRPELQCKMDFGPRRVGDLVLGLPGLKVYIDPVSAALLAGVTLDHGEEGYRFVRG